MKKLSQADRDRIEKAVKAAEEKTSGEIATAVIGKSNDYAVYELTFAVIAGLIYGLIIVIFTGNIEIFLQNRIWGFHSGYLTGFYLFSTFFVILLFYFLGNLPFVDRLIVSRKVMSRMVRNRALRHFSESGIGHTRDNTGVLIFISILERRVELLADKGIADKVEQKAWQEAVDLIISGIRNGNMVESLCHSISLCGDLLEHDFPHREDDENELSDGIIDLNEQVD